MKAIRNYADLNAAKFTKTIVKTRSLLSSNSIDSPFAPGEINNDGKYRFFVFVKILTDPDPVLYDLIDQGLMADEWTSRLAPLPEIMEGEVWCWGSTGGSKLTWYTRHGIQDALQDRFHGFLFGFQDKLHG